MSVREREEGTHGTQAAFDRSRCQMESDTEPDVNIVGVGCGKSLPSRRRACQEKVEPVLGEDFPTVGFSAESERTVLWAESSCV